METWAIFTILAALMQSIRTAGQKKLSNSLSPLVRYLYGLPVAVMYLLFVMKTSPLDTIFKNIGSGSFLMYASLASVAQIAATFWLIKVFRQRNFVIGTIFAKTETIQTAILGVIFFNAFLSFLGWFAIISGALGLIIISMPSNTQKFSLESVKYGVLSGLAFAFAALWLRESSLSLEYSYVQNAAITLTYTVSLQTVLCLAYILLRERTQLLLLRENIPISSFIGATSAFGSIGWYTAMTYQNAALVRALGQIELIFALFISYLFFGEKITAREAVGMLIITISILCLIVF